MSRLLTDDDVVEALRGVLDETIVRSMLSRRAGGFDPRQFWLVERTWADGTKQYHVRRRCKTGSLKKGTSLQFRERVAQLPPMDQLTWTQTVERVRD